MEDLSTLPMIQPKTLCRYWAEGRGCKGHPDYADGTSKFAGDHSRFFKSCRFFHDPESREKNVCHRGSRGTCVDPDCSRLHKWQDGTWSTGRLQHLFLLQNRIHGTSGTAEIPSSSTRPVPEIPSEVRQQMRSHIEDLRAATIKNTSMTTTPTPAAPRTPQTIDPKGGLTFASCYEDLLVVCNRRAVGEITETSLRKLIATSNAEDMASIEAGKHPLLSMFIAGNDWTGKKNMLQWIYN